jgi:hypothetical protein
MFKLSDTHFFQLKKEYGIEKMHNLFQDSNEAAVTEEDVIQNVQSTDVELELKIIKINKGIEITNDALPKEDCSVWKTIKNAKGIKNQVFTLNFLLIIDVFLCAIPFPKPKETVFSRNLPFLYLKLAIFYIPNNFNDANVDDNRNRVYWQNHYLSDCNINSLPFEPIKTGNTRVKTKILEIQNSDRAFHLLDRIKVRINIFYHLFKNILYSYSVSDLLIMILKLIC